jgi:P27 family predicted phage terminase small subunit
MRGRKPKPTTLKILAGNPGHRPVNDREPAAPQGIPECPDFLDEEGQAEWPRICEDLQQMGVLSTVDRTAIAAYCANRSRWIEAEKQVKKFGTIVKSPEKNFPMKSPYLCIAESAQEQMRKLLVEFGLTPSSRSRIRVGPNRQAGPLDQFLSRGNGRRA